MNQEIVVLYVPCPSQEVALGLAHDLLEKKFIFCGNILPGSVSCYRWEGVVQQEKEVILIAKTFKGQQQAAADLIQAGHPYQTPAILCFDGVSLSPDFTQWAHQEIRL